MLGSIFSALGASKDKPFVEQQGFYAAPQKVQDDLLGMYWPDAVSTYQEMRNRPKARVTPYNPSDLFASQALSAQQMAADMRAGLMPQQDMVFHNGQLQPLAPGAPSAGGGMAQGQPQGNAGGGDLMDELRGMMYLATGYNGRPGVGQPVSPLDSQRMQKNWGSSPAKLRELGAIVRQYGSPTSPEYAATLR